MAAGKFVTARTVEDAGPYISYRGAVYLICRQANISHCESNISHRRKAVYRSSPKAMTFNTPLRHASRATSPQGARQGSVDAELVATVGAAICRPWACAEFTVGAKTSLAKGGGFLRSKKTEGLENTYRTPNNPPVSASAEPAPFTRGPWRLPWVGAKRNTKSLPMRVHREAGLYRIPKTVVFPGCTVKRTVSPALTNGSASDSSTEAIYTVSRSVSRK